MIACAVIPFAMLIAAHPKLLGAGLHAAAYHQPVTRLKDVQWARHSREGHRTDKYGDVLGKATREKSGRRNLSKILSTCSLERIDPSP